MCLLYNNNEKKQNELLIIWSAILFKQQFQELNLKILSVASRNGWDDGEKALELIAALKDVAVKILEAMPASCQFTYRSSISCSVRPSCNCDSWHSSCGSAGGREDRDL